MLEPFIPQSSEMGDDIAQLKSNVLSFRLDDGPQGSQGYQRVLLQLFGFIGHGRSSLVNSCKYVLDGGEFIEHAAAPDGQSAATMIRKSYPLTNTITIVDNRGWGTMGSFQRAEVYSQLGNLVPLNESVDWYGNEEFSHVLERMDTMELDYKDFIVPVFVYSASGHLSERDLEEVRTFGENCIQMTGVWPIVVLTHKMSGDFSEVERKFRDIGAEEVIAVENYTPQDSGISLEKNVAILTFISKALENVRFRMNLPRSPKRDHIEHRKFVLNFIHEAIVAKQKEETLRERLEEQRNKSSCHIM